MRKLLLAFALIAPALQAAEPLAMDVHRDANCGGCKAWISHLEASGIRVNDHVEQDMSAVKQRLGVPPRLSSCHTGVIDGQFVEGHVPAADIFKMRAQRDLLGIAVPGMPAGSPGMETGERRDAYAVIGLQRDGQERIVAEH
ncbi:DUF411 domain-containing protein [Pseudomonas sp. LRF_L74]|uniref:DUF411 domain-containing protein n=1 Tax=Pseudomonas sp. LRF_L74 TaxID=3369422 RepID=UPI003F613F9C